MVQDSYVKVAVMGATGTAQEELKHLKALLDKETTKLQQDLAQAQEDARQFHAQLDHAERQRLQDLANKKQRRDMKNAAMKKREEEEARRRQQEMERLVTEAEKNAAMLQQRIAAIEAQKRKAEDYANRGVFGRFFSDVGSVTDGWAEGGGRLGGPLGSLIGGFVGLGVSPLVAFKRAVVGK
ncbi:hypothetical protein JVU11DRAFT_8344 [Chiua virens]|nr:hypothetical protein JVU11DRAFT_8344 [Chiua virens]